MGGIAPPDMQSAPGAPPMDPSAAAPGAATQAPPALGLQAAAAAKVAEARKTIEEAMVVFQSHTDEGKALNKALQALADFFPTQPIGAAPAAPAGIPLGGPKPGASFGM